MRAIRIPLATCAVLLFLRGYLFTATGFLSAPSSPFPRPAGVQCKGNKDPVRLKTCRNFCNRDQFKQRDRGVDVVATAMGSESDTKRRLKTLQRDSLARKVELLPENRYAKSRERRGNSGVTRGSYSGHDVPTRGSSVSSASSPPTATSTSRSVDQTSPATVGGKTKRLTRPGESEVLDKEHVEDGKVGAETFDAEELMSNVVENMVVGLKGAAEGVSPVSRRADGRFQIDGNGLLNLCILVTAGLWAVHSVMTVDATIWRGWTPQETLMRIPWDNWDSYETGLAEHPIITKTAINVVIYLLGDWLSQVNWGRDEDRQLWEFDLQRTLRNGLIAAFFGPLVHYYYDFSDTILPPDVAMNRPFKIAMDQTIFFITKCSAYIALVSFLRGDTTETIKENVREKVPAVVTTGWRFWPFVHVVTYFMIPPRHRVLWVNCVDLLWSSVLAGMASSSSSSDDSQGDGDGPAAPDDLESARAS